jgi:4-amino-4-deoxy-L-arabinose transferase-like glycosyltransferase
VKVGVLGLLLLLALALRLPFFFRDTIARDEGAFVMVGQSLLDGHLPYVERFALKPPVAFAFYAGAIAILGKSVIAVRLAGALVVAATAFLVYLTASRAWNRRVGLLASLLCVPAMSLVARGQATMTEHVAMAPVVGALYLLVRGRPSTGTCFFAGALLGIATLVRLNLAYAALGIGAFVLLACAGRGARAALRPALAYAAGGALVLALVWLPYALTGQRELWWRAVVVAPLAHTDLQPSLGRNLRLHALEAIGVVGDSGRAYVGSPLVTFVWLAALAGAAVLLRQAVLGADRRSTALIGLAALGIGFGILESGAPHGHHAIQLVPLGALLAAVFLDGIAGRRWIPAALIVAALTLISSRPVIGEYRIVAERAWAHRPLSHGTAFEVAAFLRRENPERRPVFLLSDHIAYWLSGVGPPTRLTTHPATIFEPSVLRAMNGVETSTLDEVKKVFLKKPEFVVTRGGRLGRMTGETRAWVRRVLAEDYIVATRIEGRIIYRRRAPA